MVTLFYKLDAHPQSRSSARPPNQLLYVLHQEVTERRNRDILLLTQKARVTLFDGITSELVTAALRNAEPAMVETVLSSIGARSRRMIESELGSEAGDISAEDIGRARKSIASTAIKLAGEGRHSSCRRRRSKTPPDLFWRGSG